MRLIDADALEKAINKLKFQVNMNEEVGHNRPFIDIANVLKCLDEQPTAYNVDTVVAELDKKAKRHGGEDYFVEFGDAVEIVKQGGVSDDACESSADKIKVTSLEVIVTGKREKPYYEIKYKEVGEIDYKIGYSSYDLNNVFAWRDEFFEIVNRK